MKKNKIYAICAIFLIVDQLIKLLIKLKMTVYSSVSIIPNFFSIQYIENEGAAFGLFRGATIPLVIVTIVFLFLIDKYLDQEEELNKIGLMAYGITIGGILGNLIDRLLHGNVVDYLSFHLFGWDFPVFNLADIGIVIGVGILVVDMLGGVFLGKMFKRRRWKKNRFIIE